MTRRATYLSAGRGRSLNAQEAEEEGRYPRSKAFPVLAELLGITKAAAKRAMDDYACDHAGEWHHVGARAVRVYFYSPHDVVAWIAKAHPDKLQPSCLPLRAQCRKCLARTLWTSWCEAGRGPGVVEQKRRDKEAHIQRERDYQRTEKAFHKAVNTWGDRAEEMLGPCPSFSPDIWVDCFLQVETLQQEGRGLPVPNRLTPDWFAKRFLMGPDV